MVPGEKAGDNLFGVLLQFARSSAGSGSRVAVIAAAHSAGALVTVANPIPWPRCCWSPLAARSRHCRRQASQRFGVPLGCGGPLPPFSPPRRQAQRQIPGSAGWANLSMRKANPALRLALQTREQHMPPRQKATSTICRPGGCWQVMASFLMPCNHGPDGLARSPAPRLCCQALAPWPGPGSGWALAWSPVRPSTQLSLRTRPARQPAGGRPRRRASTCGCCSLLACAITSMSGTDTPELDRLAGRFLPQARQAPSAAGLLAESWSAPPPPAGHSLEWPTCCGSAAAAAPLAELRKFPSLPQRNRGCCATSSAGL